MFSRQLSVYFALLVTPLVPIKAQTTQPPAKQEPLSPSARTAFDTAYHALESGKLPEAIAEYELALTLAPNSWDIWLEYTSALRQAGFLQKAARAGWRTVELDPEKVDSWNNLSNVLMAANALNESFEVAELMAKRFPGSPVTVKTLTNLGYTAWSLKNFALADRSLTRAIQLAPDHSVAKVDLAGVRLSAGLADGQAQLEAALAGAKKASDTNAVKWAESLLGSAKSNKGVLEAPFPRSWASEFLPPKLRTRPMSGTAIELGTENPLPRTFLLKRIGRLNLSIPEVWWESHDGSKPEAGILNLTYRPSKDDAFSVKVTGFLPPDGPKALKPELAHGILESRLGKSGTTLNWIPVPHGAMAWAKDPSWKPGTPGDYPHILTALVEVGPVWVTISAFWGESPTEPPKAFLEFISSMSWADSTNP
ncbi:MAG TPA: hypothetical protein VJ486_05250 [Geothrix sp.]|nr:hypothetical protein [Geothrix sp.]